MIADVETTEKQLLRFITCGSVDDGKSTLIGRLLYDSKALYEDQLITLASDSKKYGTTGDDLDFALLVDGLAAEREQGITIDVAYRFFATAKRKFIIADTPGHEQYTRNMATGASNANLAIVMLNAGKGMLTQTRRHSFIASMLGIQHIVLAVNKMDLIDYQADIFHDLVQEYQEFAQALGFKTLQAIPVSSLKGDNIIHLSKNMPWYKGVTLLEHLETVPCTDSLENEPFRMPVQWVNRPDLNFRGFSGKVASGTVQKGAAVKVLPSGITTKISRLITYDGDLDTACAGQSITCCLEDEIDISRGDLLIDAQETTDIADQFEVNILWMSEAPLISGRQYHFKMNTVNALCTVGKPKYQLDVNTMAHLAAKDLTLNQIGCCNITLDKSLPFTPYHKNRELGGFILIDRVTHQTIAAGFIQFALHRATNVHKQELLVQPCMRSNIKQQTPCVIWFTGLSGAGKSTIANLTEQELNAMGRHTMLLDGDNIRQGLNKDLGFSAPDRAENIRRIAEVAKLMTEAGLITLVSFISPYAAEREMAREIIGNTPFLEIFVNASLDTVFNRDVKGLYRRAKAGEIKNFTGIGSPYEPPISPDLVLHTDIVSAEESVQELLSFLKLKGM